ncbi:hypothetical protein GCM10009554_14370 [Kribbella koreensis]|uniref:Uncharacterized protein n=2 Tax=Kribbella TaxID=182639 RepID=A0ABP6YMZ4_9ACTN
MTDEIPAAAKADADRFKHLPPAVKLEDTIATHDPEDPPAPNLGRDPDIDFILRYGAG